MKTQNRIGCFGIFPRVIIFTAIIFGNILAISNIQKGVQSSESTHRRQLYAISSSRLDLVQKFCKSQLSEITSSDRQTNKQYKSIISSYLTINATKIVISMANQDVGKILDQFQNNGIGALIFISPFSVGLALLFIIGVILLFCCFSQDKCPPKCFRGDNPKYQQKQLNCPLIFLLLSCLLLVCTSIPAITRNTRFFSDFNCEVATFLDNFLNGGMDTGQEAFFSGINTIQYQLTDILKPALPDIKLQVSRLKPTGGSVMKTAIDDITAITSEIKIIPTGTDNNAFSQSYSYPLSGLISTGSLASALGPKLGKFDDSSTVLGDLYSQAFSIETKLTSIGSASSIQSHLTDLGAGSGDVGDTITNANNSLNTVKQQLLSILPDLSSLLNLLQDIDNLIQNFTLLLYCFVLGCSVVIIISVIMMKWMNIFCFRHFIHVSCIILFCCCAVLFLFGILLAIITVLLHLTCTFVENAFDIPTQFTSTVQTFYGSKYSTFTNTFSQCFGGSHNFMQHLDVTMQGYLNQLKQSVIDSHLYGIDNQISTINLKIAALQSSVNQVGLGHFPDFDPNSILGDLQIKTFLQVSTKTLFSSTCPSISYSTFYKDIWVPGLSSSYQKYVSCSGKTTANNQTCGTNIKDTSTCPVSSCFDTFSIIGSYYRSNGDITALIADSDIRYGSCVAFTNYLNNFHNNYVKIIINTIGNTVDDAAISSKIAGRVIIKAKTPLTTYNNYLSTSVKSLFTEVYNNLTITKQLDSIFNPITGVIKGLNCGLLSINVNSLVEALCIKAYNRVVFTLITVGIMAFGICVVLCCSVCFSVRHNQYTIQNGGYAPKVHPVDDEIRNIHLQEQETPQLNFVETKNSNVKPTGQTPSINFVQEQENSNIQLA